MVQHPEVLWAQRSSETDEAKNIIFLTVNLPDIQPPSLEYSLTPDSISFKTKTGDPARNIPEKEFAFNLDFYAEVDPSKSTSKLSSRSFSAVLRKKEQRSEYWPRLTKDKVRNAFLKTDFSKWVDEDEQDGAALDLEDEGDIGGQGFPGGGFGGPGGLGNMDIEKMMAQMGGAGGSGGPGGAVPSSVEAGSDSDSDDDGPPPLEDAEASK